MVRDEYEYSEILGSKMQTMDPVGQFDMVVTYNYVTVNWLIIMLQQHVSDVC